MTLAQLHANLMANIWDDDNLALYDETISTEAITPKPTDLPAEAFELSNANHMACLLGAHTTDSIDDEDHDLTYRWLFPDGSTAIISPSHTTEDPEAETPTPTATPAT